MDKLNSADPDQMPCSVASDLGLHCLPIILLGVSRLQLVRQSFRHIGWCLDVAESSLLTYRVLPQ